jgi:hypothetical protein
MVLLAMVVLCSLADAEEGPPLTVDSPTEGLITGDSWIWVRGTTGPGLDVEVVVACQMGFFYNNTTAGPEGYFEMVSYIGLFQNTVTVSAMGPLGTSVVVRNVTLDLWRPQIEIRMEFVHGVPVPYNERFECFIVGVDEIALNGTVRDSPGWNAPVAILVNGVPWESGDHPYGTFYALVHLDEGVNKIRIDATDQVGNTAYDILTIVRDTVPPQVGIITPLDGTLTDEPQCLLEGTSEAGAYIDVSVRTVYDERVYETTSAKAGTFQVPIVLFEGLQTIVVAAIDAVGNANLSYLLVTLDTVAPSISIDRPENGSGVTNGDVFTVTGSTDPEATVRVDGVQVDNSGVFQLEVALDEGMNRFKVTSVDPAGNEAWFQVEIVRDTVAPVLFITSPQRTEIITNGTVVHFAGSVRDADGVKVRHRRGVADATLVDGKWEDGDWEFDLELGELDLEQEVEVYAHDTAGNRVACTVTVVMDLVPPALNLDVRTEWATNLGTVRISGTTDEDIGELTVNGEPHPVADGVFDIEVGLLEGENSFLIVVEDRAGNSAEQAVTVTYDTIRPALELEHPSWTETGLVMVSGTTDQDVEYVFVDGQSFFVENGTFSFIIELEDEGEHEINFTVVDEAGNSRTRFATVDFRTSPSDVWFLMAPIVVLGLIAVVLFWLRRRRP